jgi:hypothetical protein
VSTNKEGAEKMESPCLVTSIAAKLRQNTGKDNGDQHECVSHIIMTEQVG